jgi:flagellar basal body-associated protein FliL
MKDNEFDSRAAASNRVIRADQRVRAVVIAVCVVSMLAGVMFLPSLLASSERHIAEQEPQAALRTLQIVVALLFLGLLPLSAYLFWFGYRAAKWRQIPPPGTWVLRDTKVIEGDRAQQRGRIVMALAVLLFGVGLFCSMYFPYRLGQVFQDRRPAPAAEATQPPHAP